MKHFKVWTQTGGSLKLSEGRWDKTHPCSSILLTIAVNGEDYLCGAMDGTLEIFKGN